MIISLGIGLLRNGAHAQSAVKIGSSSAPHPSAVLDMQIENHGMLFPTLSITNASLAFPTVSPATGLFAFSDVSGADNGMLGPGFYIWEGQWRKLMGESDAWSFKGNYNANATFFFGYTGLNVLGTRNDADFIFKRNNVRAGMIGTTNTSLGLNTLNSGSLTGTYNTAFGVSALFKNTAGSYNSAMGSQALQENTLGSYNTAMGAQALFSNISGDSNVAVGNSTLNNNILGSRNTAAGHTSMGYNNGSNNTAIGYNAQVAPNLTYATAIGANATASSSNSLVIGGTGGYAVKVGIGTYVPQRDLDISQRTSDSAGIQLTYYTTSINWRFCEDDTGHYSFSKNGTVRGFIKETTGEYVKASDKRLKKDIEDVEGILPKVLRLQPKTYRYLSNDNSSPVSFGFIAQEVEPLFPDLVSTKSDNGMKGIAYEEVGVVAIQACKEQQVQINAQSQKLKQIEQRLQVLESLKR